MDSVRSKDGTSIAFEKSGSGPALVLVHGTSADHTRWAPILPALGSHYTVYAVDRRGRGGSGDTEPYAIEREFEDVAAVVDSIGGPVNLLGHSYGAICSLEAATRTKNIRRLVLYEPPIYVGPTTTVMFRPWVLDTLRDLLAKGDREGVVTTFLREVPRLPPQELELLRSVPAWKARVAAAHTIPRELAASGGEYAPDLNKISHIAAPTLLLLGGDSPDLFAAAIRQLQQTLPNNQVVVMPGQQHTAINTAPELFTREVLNFLAEPT